MILRGTTCRIDSSSAEQLLQDAFGCPVFVYDRDYYALDHEVVTTIVQNYMKRYKTAGDFAYIPSILRGKILEDLWDHHVEPIGIALGEVRGRIRRKGGAPVFLSTLVLIHVNDTKERVLIWDHETQSFQFPNHHSTYESVSM